MAVTDAAGSVVERRFYDDFGRLLDEQKEPTAESATGLEYGFQGRRLDAETGLVYFRNRYYDPETGRFVQRDPVWDASNVGGWYTFVGNGPWSRRDAFGLDWWDDVKAEVGGVVEGVKRAGAEFVTETNLALTEAWGAQSQRMGEAYTRGHNVVPVVGPPVAQVGEALSMGWDLVSGLPGAVGDAVQELQRDLHGTAAPRNAEDFGYHGSRTAAMFVGGGWLGRLLRRLKIPGPKPKGKGSGNSVMDELRRLHRDEMGAVDPRKLNRALRKRASRSLDELEDCTDEARKLREAAGGEGEIWRVDSETAYVDIPHRFEGQARPWGHHDVYVDPEGNIWDPYSGADPIPRSDFVKRIEERMGPLGEDWTFSKKE